MFEAYASKFFNSTPFNSEDCEASAGEVDWHQKVQRNDHVEHGRRAAKWELESGKKAHNPHDPNSDEAKEWSFGYNEEKGISKDEASEDDFSELENIRNSSLKDIFNKVKGMSEEQFIKWYEAEIKGVKPFHSQDDEVTEKVSGVSKKQQALAGAVCNKEIGKHKGDAAKTAKFKKSVKGVEKSEVKYGYNPKKK